METNENRRHDAPEGVDLLALADGDHEVAEALRQLRTDVDQPVPNHVAATHLRAILTESASLEHAPSGRAWRRRVASIGGLSALKLAAGAMAAAAATGGGLAATGNLPDAAQRSVANVAERVGIDLPSPAIEAPGRPEVPGDARSDRGAERGRDDEVRPTEPGRPSEPGRSQDAPGQERRPDDPAAGRPEGGPPADAGKPEETGKPADAGGSDDAGKPADAGKPEDAGPTQTDAKKPDAGPKEKAPKKP